MYIGVGENTTPQSQEMAAALRQLPPIPASTPGVTSLCLLSSHTGPSISQCTGFFLDQTWQPQIRIKAEHSKVHQAGCVALRVVLSL